MWCSCGVWAANHMFETCGFYRVLGYQIKQMRWDTVRSRLLCKVTQQDDRGIRGQREWNDATFPWHTFDGKTLCTLHIHSGSMRIYADFPLLITRGYDYVMCYASTRHTVRGARFLVGCRLNHFKLIILLFSSFGPRIPGHSRPISISIVDDTSQVKQIGHDLRF